MTIQPGVNYFFAGSSDEAVSIAVSGRNAAHANQSEYIHCTPGSEFTIRMDFDSEEYRTVNFNPLISDSISLSASPKAAAGIAMDVSPAQTPRIRVFALNLASS